MSTVAEIVQAVKQLSAAEQRELVLQLEAVVLGEVSAEAAPPDYTGPDFTFRLAEHFHRAKIAALSRAKTT